MFLFIDTTNEPMIRIMNNSFSIVDEYIFGNRNMISEELLIKIENLLSENKIKKRDLSGIIVNTAAGSYTGQRIGVTCANFLAFSLNIPVLEQDKMAQISVVKKEKRQFSAPVFPFYKDLPHITKSKSRL